MKKLSEVISHIFLRVGPVKMPFEIKPPIIRKLNFQFYKALHKLTKYFINNFSPNLDLRTELIKQHIFTWIRYQKIANKFIVTLTSKVHEMGKQYNYYYHIFIIISSVFLCSLRIYTSMPSMRVSPEI